MVAPRRCGPASPCLSAAAACCARQTLTTGPGEAAVVPLLCRMARTGRGPFPRLGLAPGLPCVRRRPTASVTSWRPLAVTHSIACLLQRLHGEAPRGMEGAPRPPRILSQRHLDDWLDEASWLQFGLPCIWPAWVAGPCCQGLVQEPCSPLLRLPAPLPPGASPPLGMTPRSGTY